MELYLAILEDNILVIVAIGITLVLIYHYFLEKGTGAKLSKRYRNSIYEAQSKIFLNATQYLISGNKDLAIKEFLNAVDLNRETIDTYFALGGLFRSNGEIEKAISIHRSLIARENISEPMRLKSLKELALDFDKGGFIDKAIETYKDVLKINRDQVEVIKSLCRIYEDIEDWDQAFTYRNLLSKVTHEGQAETMSHILVQKAKISLKEANYKECYEELEDAFRYAPSVSAKILRLKLLLIDGNIDDAKSLLFELLHEHPMWTSFIFVSLNEGIPSDKDHDENYKTKLGLLVDFFLSFNDRQLVNSPAVILTKVRLLKEYKRYEECYLLLKEWVDKKESKTNALKVEYIKLLIELGKFGEMVGPTQKLLDSLHHEVTRHYCSECGYNTDEIFWRCPQCHEWETIQFRWKV